MLQPPSDIRKIDSRSSQENRPTKKMEKDSKRLKSTDTPFADVSSSKHQQSSTYQKQTSKKDQDYQENSRR